MKIGLYFGSFNPITRAHYAIAEHSLNFLDEVHFVVSPSNPDKEKTGELEAAEHRLEMVKKTLNFYDNKKISWSDVEFNLHQPSWTYMTIKKIIEEEHFKRPNYELYIICGKDTHHRIQTWREKEYIIDTCKFLVYSRDNSEEIEAENLHEKSTYVTDFSPPPISSTLVRNRIKHNKDIFDIVPDVVNSYICQHKLFQNEL